MPEPAIHKCLLLAQTCQTILYYAARQRALAKGSGRHEAAIVSLICTHQPYSAFRHITTDTAHDTIFSNSPA